MKKILFIFLAVMTLCSLTLFAENDDFALNIAEKLGYQESGDGGTATFAVSKTWPYDKKNTIVALAYPQEEQKDPDMTVYDLDVIIADAASSSIIARYTEKGALTSDAIYVSGIKLDTAAYDLKKNTRAFGVRISYSCSSNVNPYESSVLNLYTVSGKTVKKQLGSMVVSSSGGEWDQQCEGHFESIERTITMSGKTTKGFRDMIINGTVKEQKNVKDENDDCKEIESAGKPEKFTVKYNGEKYKVPKELLSFN